MTLNLDLDVAAPGDVPPVLRAAAEAFSSSANELEVAWQDKQSGRAWNRIAQELDRLAERVERILRQEGLS